MPSRQDDSLYRHECSTVCREIVETLPAPQQIKKPKIKLESYIYFTNRSVVFTPSAMAEGSHTVVSVVAPAFPRRHQYNGETGRREIAVYVPTGFTGKFWVYVAVDHNPRQRYVAKWFRIRVTAEDGIITEIINIREDYPDRYEPPYLKVRFPSGYWYELGTDWIASIINQ